jgi:AraC family ethanolamine operon transcriptional activator
MYREHETASAGGRRTGAVRCIETRDSDELAAYWRGWDQVYAQLAPGRFWGRVVEVDLDGMQLVRESANQPLVETGSAWTGAQIVAVPLAPGPGARFCGARWGSDAIATLPGAADFEYRSPATQDLAVMGVDAQALADHAAAVDGVAAPALDLARRLVRVGGDEMAGLRRFLIDALNAAVDSDGTVLQSEPARRSLRDALLSALVDCLRTRPESCDRGADFSARCRKDVVARARKHLLAHLDEPLTVAGLCRVLRVSRRTLQNCFNEVLGLSPVAYLRAIRLNGARRDLKAADPLVCQIQDVAAKWGFWHMGRFSAYYRQMFGEPPSATLQRGADLAGPLSVRGAIAVQAEPGPFAAAHRIALPPRNTDPEPR